jgi:hypothetical protein
MKMGFIDSQYIVFIVLLFFVFISGSIIDDQAKELKVIKEKCISLSVAKKVIINDKVVFKFLDELNGEEIK